jgi:prepilin-type N-terminal cleavage/methylation domain-containing protein
MKSHSKGFTLIELLVVIAIIGLLSTLAVVALNSARQRSRDAKRVADIRQIQTALELGFSEVQSYPQVEAGPPADQVGSGYFVGASNTGTTRGVLCNVNGTPRFVATNADCAGGTVFMGLVPANPTPNGAAYYYVGTAGNDYYLNFRLEGQTGQLQSGWNCANPDGIVGQAGGPASC